MTSWITNSVLCANIVKFHTIFHFLAHISICWEIFKCSFNSKHAQVSYRFTKGWQKKNLTLVLHKPDTVKFFRIYSWSWVALKNSQMICSLLDNITVLVCFNEELCSEIERQNPLTAASDEPTGVCRSETTSDTLYMQAEQTTFTL